jgi:hypothetical protein
MTAPFVGAPERVAGILRSDGDRDRRPCATSVVAADVALMAQRKCTELAKLQAADAQTPIAGRDPSSELRRQRKGDTRSVLQIMPIAAS